MFWRGPRTPTGGTSVLFPFIPLSPSLPVAWIKPVNTCAGVGPAARGCTRQERICHRPQPRPNDTVPRIRHHPCSQTVLQNRREPIGRAHLGPLRLGPGHAAASVASSSTSCALRESSDRRPGGPEATPLHRGVHSGPPRPGDRPPLLSQSAGPPIKRVHEENQRGEGPPGWSSGYNGRRWPL
ncbi:hypothetical protein AAFF_G00222680 [Aldrovandia affinis]|uniref:Uncharacterized protein n=1 Tax=Aldrovandia affinis TaxID=143900 RepID=A0AAD7RFL0_9TELE|nr:hypothetical protein AAFF_G00222680 [Aldrovandia affinis]